MLTRLTLLCSLFSLSLGAYTLPPVNLGFTSFLDGGVGPATPGFVAQEYIQYYRSNHFVDQQGKEIPSLKNPDFHSTVSISQFLYTSNVKLLKGNLGFNVIVPYVFSIHLNPNPASLKARGSAFGDLLFAAYIQWDTIMKGDRPLMTNRIEMNVTVPTGKNKELEYLINPGSNMVYITPYWAGTLFFTPKLSASWRLHYMWCGRDHKTHIQPGQTIFTNYSLEYQLCENFYVGINGYFLEQLQNSKLFDEEIPHSRERIFSIGPGVLYLPTKSVNLFANFYLESLAQNRPRGYRINLRAIKVF